MKRGFTLVELSISLVIIGLLIGGILVAQSLIDSSKIQSEVKQIQQFDIALSLFQNNYGSLPGDSDKFSNPGDNDGFIEIDLADTSSSYASFNGEVRYFWSHLSLAGFANNEWSFYTDKTTNCITGPPDFACDFSPPSLQIPPSKLSDEAGIMVAYDENFLSTLKHSYFVSNYNTDNIEESSNDTIDCGAIMSVDTKLDDGLHSSGIMEGYSCSTAGLYDPEKLGAYWIDILASTDNGI